MFKNLILIVAAVCGSAQAQTVTVPANEACNSALITPSVTEVTILGGISIPSDDPSSCAVFNNEGARTVVADGIEIFLTNPAAAGVVSNTQFVGVTINIYGANFVFEDCGFTNCTINCYSQLGVSNGLDFTGTATVFNNTTLHIDSGCVPGPVPAIDFLSTVTIMADSGIASPTAMYGGAVKLSAPSFIVYSGLFTQGVQGPMFTSDSTPVEDWTQGTSLVLYPEKFGIERADLDGDGVIGFGDQQIVLSRWGDRCSAWNDPDRSEVYDFGDIQLINSLWGQTY